jgi:WD40 repeat protein
MLGTFPEHDPLLDAARAAGDEGLAEYQRLADAYTPWLKHLRHDGQAILPPLPDAGGPLDPTGEFRPRYDFLSPPGSPDELGRLGRFVVRRTLGAGGMGIVFVADDPRLGRSVALKVVRPELLGRADSREKFLAEARSIAGVENEHVVGIHEADEANGVPYLVMPLLQGESLEEHGTRRGPLPIDELLRLAREIAEGLRAAHERGLIHRDIKPANVFVTEQGRAKILDFGLAQALGGSSENPDDVGKICGTLSYMTPEQALSNPVDARADLFSLGCVMYRLATNRKPFHGTELLSLLIQVVEHHPEPPTKLRPDLPSEVEALILRLLEKRPDDRPASAREVVESIRTIERRRSRAARWPRLLAAVAAVMLAAGLTFWLTPRNGAEVAPEDPAEVTLSLDEADQRLIIRRGEDDEETIDLKTKAAYSLKPGTYTLRPAVKSARALDPGVVVLAPGEKKSLELRLVGEVRSDLDCPAFVRDVACAGRGEGFVVLATGGAARDPSLCVWKPNADANGGDWEEHANQVFAVTLSADGKVAASGGGGKGRADTDIRIWDVARGKATAKLAGVGEGDITALALSADSKRLLAGDRKEMLTLWDVPAAKVLRTWTGHDRLGVNGVALRADVTRGLSAGGDGRVILWDVARGTEVKGHADHKGAARTVAFAPDGKSAVSGGADGNLIVWEIEAGKRRKPMPAHQGGVHRVCYSPDGNRILSGGADGVVRLWDAASGEEVISLKGHTQAVHGVGFSSDGRRAVSGGSGRQLRLWELPR